MRISAPYPEIGAPKVGKKWGVVHRAYAQFFSVFGVVHSASEVLSACKIFHGALPSARDLAKNGVCYMTYMLNTA